jgi:antitoxin (DNA-binding transcriptional repressor) of toxin-antitoxin stability system
MEIVGIRILKDQLSKYLDIVRGGEIVIITDRNKEIAQISLPPSLQKRKLSASDTFIKEEINLGYLVPAKRKKSEIDQLLGKKKITKQENINWKTLYLESRED